MFSHPVVPGIVLPVVPCSALTVLSVVPCSTLTVLPVFSGAAVNTALFPLVAWKSTLMSKRLTIQLLVQVLS